MEAEAGDIISFVQKNALSYRMVTQLYTSNGGLQYYACNELPTPSRPHPDKILSVARNYVMQIFKKNDTPTGAQYLASLPH